MADALLSPEVGLGFHAVSAGALACAARRIRRPGDALQACGEAIRGTPGDRDTALVPLMGVMGAFVFAAQTINFAIPGTGSSGHLGGGMLLAVMLGPWAALIVLFSVVAVQCLAFGDGGLLALGCNVFNIGVLPCFVGLPIARAVAGRSGGGRRVAAGVAAGCVSAAALGAVSVAAETALSGRSDLPFLEFGSVMAAIHVPIGVVEGVVTVAVSRLTERLRPGTGVLGALAGGAPRSTGDRRVLVAFGLASIALVGAVSALASSAPDGLEWSVRAVAGAPGGEAGDAGGGPPSAATGLAGAALAFAAALFAGAVAVLVRRARARGRNPDR